MHDYDYTEHDEVTDAHMQRLDHRAWPARDGSQGSARARILVGTAALALAVTIPDISIGAMNAPHARFTLGHQTPPLPANVWVSGAVAPRPVYAPATPVDAPATEVSSVVGTVVMGDAVMDTVVMEGDVAGAGVTGDVEPATRDFFSTTGFGGFERRMPVAVLDQGGERFDLQFADAAMPYLENPAVSPSVSQQSVRRGNARIVPATPAATLVATAPIESLPARAHLVAMPQITVSRGFSPAAAPDISFSTPPLPNGALATGPLPNGALPNGAPVTPQLATGPLPNGARKAIALTTTDQAIEAAFAGAIDAVNAAKDLFPAEPAVKSRATDPVAQLPQQPAREAPIQPPALALAIREPGPAVSASAAAQAELIAKTKMDARVNGVLTGSVEFRQLDGTIAIQLRSVVGIMHDRFSAIEIDHLNSGQAIDSYITLGKLQAAGIPVRYDAAYDELHFGVDYDDAPNAAKVQVEQIGMPTVGSDRTGMDQLSRGFGQ